MNAVVRLVRQRSLDPHAHVVAAGHHPGPRRRAHGLRHVEVGEDPALLGHPVQVWRLVALGAERADVGIAHVVDENDDKVGQTLLGRAGPAISPSERQPDADGRQDECDDSPCGTLQAVAIRTVFHGRGRTCHGGASFDRIQVKIAPLAVATQRAACMVSVSYPPDRQSTVACQSLPGNVPSNSLMPAQPMFVVLPQIGPPAARSALPWPRSAALTCRPQ